MTGLSYNRRMEIKQKLAKRLKNATEADIDLIVNIINKYDLDVSVRNFDNHGLFFLDGSSTVRVMNGQLRDRSVHIKHPYSDIVIVYSDGLLAGWTTRDKLDDLEDRVSIDIKSLNPMPDSFSFKQTCAHLSEHGGFYDGEFWECAGCQQRLVFNDKV